jgi:flagellar L-ring protein FlgH
MSKRRIIIATTTLGIGSTVLAQSAPPQEHQKTMQAVMQGNGGSLLQASPAAAIAPGTNGASAKTAGYSMYAVAEQEPKVLKKHDLINIVVQEVNNFQATGTTDLQRASDLDAKVDQFVYFNPKSMSLHGTGQATNPVEIKMEGSRDFKGDAAIDSSNTITLRLEAEVIDVKPNGTLVVQSKKHIKTDEEEETIILTGVCRVQDVDATNSVLSTDLQDLDLQKVTKGAIRDTNKRGLLHRLLDFINPF